MTGKEARAILRQAITQEKALNQAKQMIPDMLDEAEAKLDAAAKAEANVAALLAEIQELEQRRDTLKRAVSDAEQEHACCKDRIAETMRAEETRQREDLNATLLPLRAEVESYERRAKALKAHFDNVPVP